MTSGWTTLATSLAFVYPGTRLTWPGSGALLFSFRQGTGLVGHCCWRRYNIKISRNKQGRWNRSIRRVQRKVAQRPMIKYCACFMTIYQGILFRLKLCCWKRNERTASPWSNGMKQSKKQFGSSSTDAVGEKYGVWRDNGIDSSDSETVNLNNKFQSPFRVQSWNSPELKLVTRPSTATANVFTAERSDHNHNNNVISNFV